MPWDVVALYNMRQYLDSQQYQLMHYEGRTLLPTPRTLESPSAYALWCKWAEDEEKYMQENNKSFSDLYDTAYVTGYVTRFDAQVWDRKGVFVLYNVNWHDERYLDIVPFDELHTIGKRVSITPKGEGSKEQTPTTHNVFGSGGQF